MRRFKKTDWYSFFINRPEGKGRTPPTPPDKREHNHATYSPGREGDEGAVDPELFFEAIANLLVAGLTVGAVCYVSYSIFCVIYEYIRKKEVKSAESTPETATVSPAPTGTGVDNLPIFVEIDTLDSSNKGKKESEESSQIKDITDSTSSGGDGGGDLFF